MKQVLQILITGLMSTCLWAADEVNPNQPPPPREEQQAAKEEKLKPGNENLTYRQRMVTGKVDEVKEIDITADGKAENHLLVKVTTLNKHVVIVDLGPKAGLKNEIKAGDEIAAFGITGRLNERPLIVASKFAQIMPIEGRDDIYESIPVSYNQDGQNQQNQQGQTADASNQRFAQDALQRSNANDGRYTGNTLAPERRYTNGPPPGFRECPDQ